MSKDHESSAVTASVRIYERLLALYPAKFRREFGPAMKQVFRDQCRDAWSESQRRGLSVLWLRLLPDLAKTTLVEHLLNLKQRESLLMRVLHAFRTDPRLRAAFNRVFVIAFVVAIVCSGLIAQWTPRDYSSKVVIETHSDSPRVSMSRGQPTNYVGNTDPYFLPTQLKIIQSYGILTNVIVELKLDQKLADQLGKPRWTLDETYLYLTKMIRVENTPETYLIEITVNNRDPKMAADIADKIVSSYRNDRLNEWKDTHLQGIEAYRSNLIAKAQLLKEQQDRLDEMRQNLHVPEPDAQASNSTTIESRMLEVWAERAAMEKADYLEYSNILFKVSQTPQGKLGAALPTVFRSLTDPEFAEKSTHLSFAKEILASVERDYGANNPKYKTALADVDRAQQDYDNKVEGIVTSIKNRVDEDSSLIQIMEQNETEIKARQENQEAVLRPYYRLKDEVDSLRYNNRESERYFNQEVAEAGQPDTRMVIVRDPARPAMHPVNSNSRTFLTWAFRGTLLAVVAGGAAAWLSARIPRLSHRHSGP